MLAGSVLDRVKAWGCEVLPPAQGIRATVVGASQYTIQVSGSTIRSEEHTSELQSLMRISYAVFCLKKKKKINTPNIYKEQKDTHTSSMRQSQFIIKYEPH